MTDNYIHIHMHRFCTCSNSILQFLPAVLLTVVLVVSAGCSSPTKSTVDSPGLSVDTAELSFGESLAEQTFSISNDGSGSLEWAIFVASDAPWCSAEPGAGTGNTTITVTVDRTQMLRPGDYTAVITVSSNGGTRELRVHAISSSGIIIIDTPLPE